MKQGLKWLLLPLLSLAICASAHAVLMTDLYTGRAKIDGAEQSVSAEAAAQALAQVFVKVSGSSNVLRRAEIKAALAQARNGQREFVHPQSNATQFSALQRAFGARGLPLETPLYDLKDSAAFTPDKAWGMVSGTLRDVSARYDRENILAGRFVLQDDGSWSGDWAYISPQGRRDLRDRGQSFADVATAAAALVAEPMASRYAVATSGKDAAAVTLHVTGIRSYADYAQVMQLLERIELIERVDVIRVADDTLSVSLEAQTSTSGLAGLLELNRQMTPMEGAQVHGELSYQWTN